MLLHRAGQDNRLGDFLNSRIDLAAGLVIPLHIQHIQSVRLNRNLIEIVTDPVELLIIA